MFNNEKLEIIVLQRYGLFQRMPERQKNIGKEPPRRRRNARSALGLESHIGHEKCGWQKRRTRNGKTQNEEVMLRVLILHHLNISYSR